MGTKNAPTISKIKLTYQEKWKVIVNPSVYGREFYFPLVRGRVCDTW